MCVGLYSGGWVAGQPHGEGRFKEARGYGRDYRGWWRNGQRHGQGTMTFASGPCDGIKCAPNVSPL